MQFVFRLQNVRRQDNMFIGCLQYLQPFNINVYNAVTGVQIRETRVKHKFIMLLLKSATYNIIILSH